MRSFITRVLFLSALTAPLVGFARWSVDGHDPLLLTPMSGDGHPSWIIDPYGAVVLISTMAAYLYAVVRHESVPQRRWVFMAAATFVTVFLGLWPDIYGTLRFGRIDVIEWQVDRWLLPGLQGDARWISCGLFQIIVLWALTLKNREHVARRGNEGSQQ